MRKNISAIFWDLDGTLINSENLHHQASYHASAVITREHSLKMNQIQIDTTGLDNQGIFQMLFTKEITKDAATLFDYWESLAVEYLCTHLSKKYQIEQSVALFNHFHELGLKQSIVSNATGVVVRCALQVLGITDKCQHIFSRDLVTEGKPSPIIYHKAIEAHQQPAIQCLAFEDSASGIIAAKLAGVNVVGIGSASIHHGPDLICDFIDDDWLGNINKHYRFI